MTSSSLVGTTFFGLDISRLSEKFRLVRRRVSKRVLLLEFAPGLLRLAEAVLTPEGVQLNHISKLTLPEEALDRGVPADPAKMAGLLKEVCREKAIPAHRVAVVISPEAAFQRLVDLPAELSTDQAREFVLDPANGVQIPFPLAQTDFDLAPVTAPPMASRSMGMRLYMLSAIPQVLVDQVVEMLRLADLELQLLELGSFSQLRPIAADLVMLPSHQVDLLLELLPDCSTLMFVSASGLLGSERLASIRDFPEPELDEEQAKDALEAGLSAEAITVQDERYLPLSDLDLRVLVDDVRAAIGRFVELFPGAEIAQLRLTGINSAHPLLVELLEAALSLPVVACRPLLAPGVTGFAPDQVLVQTGLARLTGLGLALLPTAQLMGADPGASQEPVTGSDSPAVLDAMPTVPAMAPMQTVLEDRDATERFKDQELERIAPGTDAVVVSREVEEATPASEEEEEWPSIGAELLADVVKEEKKEESTLVLGDEKVAEVVAEATPDSVEEEEWPSIGAELLADVVKEEKKEESTLVLGDEKVAEVVAEATPASEEEEEWPSIGAELLADVVKEEKKEESTLVLGDEKVAEVVAEATPASEEEEEWPSIGAELLADVVKEEKKEESTLLLAEEKVAHIVDEEDSLLNSFDEYHPSRKLAAKGDCLEPDSLDEAGESFRNMIPGLPLAARSESKDADDDSQNIIASNQFESSLGELRFADE